jgi:hypothetical protein
MTKQRKFFTCMLILLLYFVAGAGNGISEVSSNMIVNGDFSKGTDEWNLVTLSGGEASFFTEKGWLCLHILKEGNQPYSIIVNQQGLYIEKGRTYMVSFNAYCKSGKRNIHVKVGLAAEPWTLYSEYKTYEISTQKKEFSFHFTMAKPTDTDAYIEFQLGTNKTDVYLDEIVVKKTGNNDDTDISSDSHTYDLGKYKIILGKQETLLNDGAFGLHYFPDNCISVLDTSPTYRIIMAAGVDTYLLEGIDI